MIEIIKRKKMEGLILNVIVIIVVITTIILNSDIYKQIFTEKNLITNKETLNDVIKKDKRFVTLDLTNAELTRFSIKNNTEDKIEINTYKITYDDQTLIVFLRENTAVTNKIKGELITPKNEKLEIQKKLKEELDSENIIDISFSNVDYMREEFIIKTKFIISICSIALLIIFSIFDVYYFINPKKTKKYKNYRKKNKKAN